MVSDEVLVGGGEQGGQSPEEGHRVEQDLGPAVGRGPGAVEPVADAACGVEGEAVEGEGCPQAVAAELLEAVAVAGLDGACGMEREAPGPGAQGLVASGEREVVGHEPPAVARTGDLDGLGGDR